MDVLDVFKGDAFSMASLTKSINTMDHKPQRLGEMGLFEEEGITTTVVQIEAEHETLKLVPATPRGGVGTPGERDPRTLLSFTVPHLQEEDAILADEVQNVRAFGVADQASAQLQGVQAVVGKKQQRLINRLEVTIEYHRMGAVKGVILDADGTRVIFNLFDKFSVQQQKHALVMDTAGTDVPQLLRVATRLLESALGSTVYSRLHCLCGSSFIDKLLAHASIKDWFKANPPDARLMREEDVRYNVVRVGNIVFEEYRGNVSGVAFVDPTEGYLFAEGVPGLFVTNFAPADYVETVNTIGLPYYSKQEPKRMGKGVDIEVQTNPLCLCTRPKSIIQLHENAIPGG